MSLITTRRHAVSTVVALGVVTALGLSGCASAGDSSGGSTATGGTGVVIPQALIDAAVAKAKEVAADEQFGGSLSVVGIVGGEEGDAITAAMAPFTTATGTAIDYTASQDQSKVVQAAVDGGNPPDLVDGQGSGLMQDFARQGQLLSISEIVGDETLRENFNQGLLDVASVDGTVYGLWGEADSFAVWYNTATYDGPKDASSWTELEEWATQQAATGVAPWCLGLEAGGGSGWPGESWIQNTFLKMWGPEKMAAWASGELPWTSPEVKAAFERFGSIATSATLVNGGPQTVVSTSFANYADGMFTDPQQCQLSLWGNYIGGLVTANNPAVEIPADMDFFPVPADNAEGGESEAVAGHVLYAFKEKDSPALRAFVKYWASAEARALIAASGRWSVANNKVPLDAYPNEAMRASAELLNQAKYLSPGPSTTQGSAVISAWDQAIIAYVQDPSSLDAQLAKIQAASGK
ncbi:MAG TPA: ABC transporter substrate-binding protein [Plantibacter sp.]|uniref:ABC transporter substrate-binding protein n=1 Tax=unclassified Plantibacter TaxID=2624265 RepID=UPI002C65BFB7|nr:ABC transporter substrate-binding protein [Plantibacter sp.]